MVRVLEKLQEQTAFGANRNTTFNSYLEPIAAWEILVCIYDHICVVSGDTVCLEEIMSMVLHGAKSWSRSADVPLEIATKSDKCLLIVHIRLSSSFNHKFASSNLISISLRPPTSWRPPFQSHSNYLPTLTTGHEPVTFRGATLFLEAPLHFNESVEFHGNLSVIAVRVPLDGPCFHLEKDGVVKPGAELRLANCRRKSYERTFGGAMEVDGNLLIHGDLHIRKCSAGRGGPLCWSWSQTGWTSDIIVFVSCVCAWNMSTQAELMWWGKIIVIPIDLQVGVVFSCIFFFGSPQCYESVGLPKPFDWKPLHLLDHRSHLRAEHLHPVEWQTDDLQLIGPAFRRRGAPWISSWGSFEMLLDLALRLWHR